MPKMDLECSYQRMDHLTEEEENEDKDTFADGAPGNPGVMIHVVPESGKSRWNHIEDLDSFFTRIYHYHQNHGFFCMMLQETFELGQLIFVVVFVTFLFHGVDYTILFKDRIPAGHNKTSLSDAILPMDQALLSMGGLTWISLVLAGIFWLFCAIRVFYHFVQFWDIKSFFNDAMKIADNDLDNLTWHEILKRIILVQKDQEMCIHKKDLTELDIYHRMLRFKNYMVAMINKSLLPVQLKIPFLGNVIFVTQGLQYNFELLMFWGPWSPFENSWHLREDYKRLSKRQELAKYLSNHIFWVGIANFVLCPVIFLWQILHFFFNYGELLNREPGALGMYVWSNYSRLYIRHFNELDHELKARLNRAYRPASKYMDMFTSPLMTILAKNLAFISGSVFAVFLALTFYDEDFLTVEHVLMITTVTGSVAAICRSIIPDENLVWCPESLLTAVLAHTHYGPDSWRGKAHTHATREQMAQLFQPRAVQLLQEVLSPLITPYILCFHLRYKAQDIVDFYRNFTVELTGVGDVCSFAQMDIKKHGNPAWQTQERKKFSLSSNPYTQAEDGKTELSLIHFMLTNPQWKPPTLAEDFVAALRTKVKREAATVAFAETNPLHVSINSLSSLGPEYTDVVSSIMRSNFLNPMGVVEGEASAAAAAATTHVSVAPTMSSNQQRSCMSTSSCGQNTSNQAINMSLSALYLHEVHRRQLQGRDFHERTSRNIWSHSPLREDMDSVEERSPLLQHADSSIKNVCIT